MGHTSLTGFTSTALPTRHHPGFEAALILFYVIQAPWSVPFRRFAHAMLSDTFLPFQGHRAEDRAFYEVKVLLAFAGQGPSSNAFGCRSPPLHRAKATVDLDSFATEALMIALRHRHHHHQHHHHHINRRDHQRHHHHNHHHHRRRRRHRHRHPQHHHQQHSSSRA